MTKYVPILKSKEAEHWAWRQASVAVVAGSRPVFEVVPTDKSVQETIETFVNRVTDGWPPAAVLTADTGHLDQTQPIAGTPHMAIFWTARRLHRNGVPSKPVMRLDDDPQVLTEVAAAAGLHGEGACLRLGSGDEDPSVAAAASLWPQVRATTGLVPAEVDLLIDLREIRTPRDVSRAATVAARVLHWADQNGPWRSMTVASGAFPEQISDLPIGVTRISRRDAEFFNAVVANAPSILPDFGDYAIWHPDIVDAFPRGPLPNLRYTSGMDWQVYREERILPGNQSFYTLCQRVVSSPHWPGPGYSAGDNEIDQRAQGNGGPGRATDWLRWGASHHFAHVVDRLSSRGGP